MVAAHGDNALRRGTARVAAIGLITGHNVVQNTILNEEGYVLGNAVTAAVLIGLGERSGSSWDEMGLEPRLDAEGRRAIAAIAAATILPTVAALVNPTTRAMLRDERARDNSWRIISSKALIRFPLGTALFEEIAFRGVLPQLLGKSDKGGDLLSSAAFGAWHVIPTARILGGNPLGRAANPVHTVAAGSAAAALAGLLLTSVRRRTGSIVVPWLLHSIFNVTTYLGGVIAWRLGGERSDD